MKQKSTKILFFSAAALFVLAIVLFVCLGLPVASSVSAETSIKDANVSYNSVEKIISINENKVLNVTERITVSYKFGGINVGLSRNVSRVNKITRIVNGKKYVTTTLNKLELVSVTMDGLPEYNFLETSGDYFYINTGADYDYKEGTHVYEINYLYDMGEDFIDEFDDFTFDIMDYGFRSNVENFSAKVTFPASFLDGKDISQVLSFRTNNMAPVKLDTVNAKWDEESLTLSCSFPGFHKENGLTMQLILPEDYFDTYYAPGALYWACLASIIICAIAIAVIVLVNRLKKQGVIVPEFYPPKDLSAIDVAKVYRGYPRAKDFASLVIGWAAKGYVSINVLSKSRVVLKKLKDMEKNDHNEYEYFSALFADKNEYDTKKDKSRYNRKLTSAVRAIYQTPWVDKKKTLLLRAAVSLLAILPFVLINIWAGMQGLGMGGVSAIILLFPIIALIVFVYTPIPLWFKIIWCAGFGGAPLGIMVSGMNTSYDILNLIWPILVIFLLGFFSARFIKVLDEDAKKYRPQVLGFKHFLVTAELDKLNMLVEADPDYYYNILPYCYIFGITKKMQKKFAALEVKEPKICGDFETAVVFGCLCHSVHGMGVGSSFSGGGSGGGGGGGGSSGGGGGGGGCGGR